MTKQPCVYILATKRNGTLYVGVTSQILRRGWEHKSNAVSGFTKTYGIHLLVHVEFYESMPEAIAREKQLKNWKRAWKIELIERANPQWRDMYEDMR
jgi:putative endonuclease